MIQKTWKEIVEDETKKIKPEDEKKFINELHKSFKKKKEKNYCNFLIKQAGNNQQEMNIIKQNITKQKNDNKIKNMLIKLVHKNTKNQFLTNEFIHENC